MSGFTYFTQAAHTEAPLASAPPVEPAPRRPWWRHPATHLAAGLVVLGAGTVVAVQVTTALQPLDLVVSPSCSNGSYVVSWGLPGDRYTDVEMRSPKEDLEQAVIRDYKVEVRFRGSASGQVRAVIRTEQGQRLLAGTPAPLDGTCR